MDNRDIIVSNKATKTSATGGGNKIIYFKPNDNEFMSLLVEDVSETPMYVLTLRKLNTMAIDFPNNFNNLVKASILMTNVSNIGGGNITSAELTIKSFKIEVGQTASPDVINEINPIIESFNVKDTIEIDVTDVLEGFVANDVAIIIFRDDVIFTFENAGLIYFKFEYN